MCHIQHYRMSERLHLRNTSIIDNQILITKCCTTFRQHHLIVTCLYHFISRKTHGSRRQELTFFNIDNFSGASCRNQQIGLTTKKCRYLQHIHIFSSHFCFGSSMNICYYRHIKRTSNLSQDFQRLFITYSRERIQTRTVRFSVRTFKNVWNMQFIRNFNYSLRNTKSHILSFYHTRTCQQEKHIIPL